MSVFAVSPTDFISHVGEVLSIFSIGVSKQYESVLFPTASVNVSIQI